MRVSLNLEETAAAAQEKCSRLQMEALSLAAASLFLLTTEWSGSNEHGGVERKNIKLRKQMSLSLSLSLFMNSF